MQSEFDIIKQRLLSYKLVIFDLDNTLYEETDYLFSAYRKIAKYCVKHFQGSEEDYYYWLKHRFLSNGHGHLFDHFFKKFDIPKTMLRHFLQILRYQKIDEGLVLYSWCKPTFLALLDKKIHIGVLTNGNPVQQRNKIKHLNFDEYSDKITFVCANELNVKPAPDGVEHLVSLFKVKKNDVIFVGDSIVDEQCALNANTAFLKYPIK